MSEAVVTWQDKIPGWQQQSQNWRTEIEVWQGQRDEFLDANVPGTVTYLENEILAARANDETSANLELLVYKDEYPFYRELCFKLRDHFDSIPAYRAKLLVTDNHGFDEQTASTVQPTKFEFALTVTWDPSA